MASPRPAFARALAALTLGALTTTSLALGSSGPASAVANAGATVFVNELHYDNDGTDTDEIIEVAGPAGTDLAGWSLVLYNGNGGAVYGTVKLSGVLPDTAGGYGMASFAAPGIQNGAPDGVALVDDTGAPVQFLSYEGSFAATSGVASGLTSTDIGRSEPSTTPAGQSLQLTGTGTTYGDFSWAAPAAQTAGTVNTGQSFGGSDPDPEPVPACTDPVTKIHDIQGSGPEFDPGYSGTRSISGVATSVMPGLQGFWVQEESSDADQDPSTSEGIFVYAPGQPAPAEGTVVRVTGTVAEFGGKTQLNDVTTVLGCGDPASAVDSTPVSFPLATPGALERHEGMLVELVDELVISEYFDYDRYGEVVVGRPFEGDRLWTPTAVTEPGAEARELAEEHAKRVITIDDRSTRQNPSVLVHPGNGAPFSLENRFRGGDTITGIQGVLDDAFGTYRLQPTAYGDYTASNPRPATRPAVGGDVQVASFNVLNYFLTFGSTCGPAENQDCRGADNQTELERQRAKILAALAELDADVVGLMEMENTPGVEPAADLVEGLNAMLGQGTYDYVDTGVVGTDAIRLGFLYKPGAVQPAGDVAVLDSRVDPRFDDRKNRPMLTQTFDTVAATGDGDSQRFTVSVNHLKSKGSSCDDAGDPDTGDGQGNCNVTRTAAAHAIVDHLAADPTGSGDPDHLVIGDLNSYDHEDPIRALVNGGIADQVRRFGGEHAYGYVFDGSAGYLDHALANDSLARQVTGTAEWHINADEPDVLDYDTSFKPTAVDAIYAADPYRSSDHDPVLVGLDLAGAELDVHTTPQRVWEERTRIKVHVAVTDPSGAPATGGTVTVLQDGEVLGTENVVEGEARVRLPAFPTTGEQELTVVYTGTAGVTREVVSLDVEPEPGR